MKMSTRRHCQRRLAHAYRRREESSSDATLDGEHDQRRPGIAGIQMVRTVITKGLPSAQTQKSSWIMKPPK